MGDVHVGTLGELKWHEGDWTEEEENMIWVVEEAGLEEEDEEEESTYSDPNREEAEVWNLPESPGSFM